MKINSVHCAEKSFIARSVVPKTSVSFKGHPWRLDLGPIGYTTSISADTAIAFFDKLKLGNYLDLNGKSAVEYDRAIRSDNLSFLDKLTRQSDKEGFIAHYKKITGFPSLSTVSKKIHSAFTDAVNRAEASLQGFWGEKTPFEVLSCGYDGVSSTAKAAAFPGSDLDKAFVLIRGNTEQSWKNKEIVNIFKGKIWENTDQRILSYNHDTASFPFVYTLDEVQGIMSSIDEKTAGLKLHGFGLFRSSPTKYETYCRLCDTYTNDYVAANPFFIDVCKQFPIKNSWETNPYFPSRENIYNFGYFAESFFKGDKFKDKTVMRYGWNPESSDFAKLINVSQISALKKTDGPSAIKYNARKAIEREFDTWPIDQQLGFIKTTIKKSCGDYDGSFPQFFKSAEESKFTHLMQEIGLRG